MTTTRRQSACTSRRTRRSGSFRSVHAMHKNRAFCRNVATNPSVSTTQANPTLRDTGNPRDEIHMRHRHTSYCPLPTSQAQQLSTTCDYSFSQHSRLYLFALHVLPTDFQVPPEDDGLCGHDCSCVGRKITNAGRLGYGRLAVNKERGKGKRQIGIGVRCRNATRVNSGQLTLYAEYVVSLRSRLVFQKQFANTITTRILL
jgi:hypothetical protein